MTAGPTAPSGNTEEDREAPALAPRPFPDRLTARVAAFAPNGFALLDGGLFENFPAELRRAGLFGRSLFLDHADKEVEAAGPWLVALDQGPDAPDKVFRLVGDRPAAVFWFCAGGDVVLYRHLRTLNMARLPAWAAAGESGPRADGSGEEHEAVLFRHWDPRVLGALLPVLDAGQFARFVGPAQEVAFWAEEYGGLKRIVSDPAWPQARSGMLTISAAQIEALTARRVEARRFSVAAYLRDAADGALDGASDADIRGHVLASEARARDLGIVTEAGHCRWAFLMLITRGQVGEHPAVAEFIRNGAHPPDRQVEDVMDATSRAVRGSGGVKPGGARP